MSTILVRLLQEVRRADEPETVYPPGTLFHVAPNEASSMIKLGVAELAVDANTQLEFAIEPGHEKRKARNRTWH